MKTRRSNKSFEMAPVVNRRKPAKRRRALNVVNETIVLSDSEDEIQVIDEPNASNSAASSNLISNEPAFIRSGRSTPSALKPESENLTGKATPLLVDIEEEERGDGKPDDDGLEVVAVVVSSSKRSSLKRKSCNGNLAQSHGIVKRALETARRTSIVGSRNADLVQIQNPLFRIASSSRQIGRQTNKKKKWKRNKFRMGGGGGNFEGARRNALFHNRTRENDREIIFRPDSNKDQASNNIIQNQNNFSFEATPFIPINSSTPAFKRYEDRGKGRPVRRRDPGPAPIAPGSNIMNAGEAFSTAKGDLRPIVIDGSNVAVGHGGMLQGGGNKFSARGIQICIDYFKRRGHKDIVVFVPRFRLKKAECRDPELLEEMERQGHVKFTPSREAGGQRIASYDDLFVVEYAHSVNGIIISNDFFKDLYDRKQHLQNTIKFRLLQYTWITQDVIMFPEDPLGRNGPSLDEFLRF